MNKNRCVSWIFNFCTFESRSYFAAYITHIWFYEKYTVLCEQCKLNSYGATPVTGQSETILMIKLIVEIIFHPKIQTIPWFQLLNWDSLLLFFVLCSCTRGCSISNILLTNKSIEKMIGRIVAALSAHEKRWPEHQYIMSVKQVLGRYAWCHSLIHVVKISCVVLVWWDLRNKMSRKDIELFAIVIWLVQQETALVGSC